jgi:hypothetical protein
MRSDKEGGVGRVGADVIHVLSCSKEFTLVQSNTKIAVCIEGSRARAKSVDDATCEVSITASSWTG